MIIPLVNNWGEYGGLPAYAAWASATFGGTYAHDDFYTNAQMKQWWKDYAYTLATRVNTFTGVPYRDEPAILAWEIGNEMRCSSCAGTTKLPDAIAELATFLKQVAPNQLIADGGDGFDDDPTPYVGLSNYYAVRGDEGASFSKLGRVEALDLLSYHFYPRNYGFSTARDTEIWIERHQAIAALTGKVAYLGECGFVAPDQERGQTLRRVAAPPVRAVRRPARSVLAALARRPHQQRRLRRLLPPRQRHGLHPVPLGPVHPLTRLPPSPAGLCIEGYPCYARRRRPPVDGDRSRARCASSGETADGLALRERSFQIQIQIRIRIHSCADPDPDPARALPAGRNRPRFLPRNATRADRDAIERRPPTARVT